LTGALPERDTQAVSAWGRLASFGLAIVLITGLAWFAADLVSSLLSQSLENFGGDGEIENFHFIVPMLTPLSTPTPTPSLTPMP
jgi:hypothetical protein